MTGDDGDDKVIDSIFTNVAGADADDFHSSLHTRQTNRVIRIGPGKRWRVYPSGNTTVAELTGALEAFPVVCVVDEDGAVCLQMIGDGDDGRPSLQELAAALWGPDNTATLVDESGLHRILRSV